MAPQAFERRVMPVQRSGNAMGGPVRYVNPSAVPRHSVAEFEFVALRDFGDPWAEIEFDVEFTDPDGRIHAVPAYWAGGRTWRVRYSSGIDGVHEYRTVVRGTTDGFENRAGTLRVVGYEGANPLLLRGGPRVADDDRHFSHADGTPFFWLADTWWSGMTRRFRWPDVFQEIADDRADKGFTVVLIVAGMVPEFDPFSADTASEGGQPWEGNGSGRINPAFYAVPDAKIDYLVSLGMSPCIVGGWGGYAELLGAERVRLHWRYLVARYGAYPVTWCIAGEVDSPGLYSLDNSARKAQLLAGPPTHRVKMWEDAARYVATVDPFRRPRTVHPSPAYSFSSSDAFESRDSFDFDMLQTGHGGPSCVPATMTQLRRSLDHGDKPALNGECCFEGIFDSNWQDVQRFLFWSHLLSGAAGHTYGTMPISSFNSREDPHVPLSQVSMHYWEDAINWLGAGQLGVGRKILEQLNWQQLAPEPAAVEPQAGPDDWFLPYAAAGGGTVVVYIPSLVLASDTVRLDRIVLGGLSPRTRYRGRWINPRDGRDHSSFEFESESGRYRLPARGMLEIPMPTGEDWVLVATPIAVTEAPPVAGADDLVDVLDEFRGYATSESPGGEDAG